MSSHKKSIGKSNEKALTTSSTNIPSFSSQTELNENLENLTTLLSVLDKNENSLQAIREALTLRQDFNPETLFKYLTNSENELTKKHIISLM